MPKAWNVAIEALEQGIASLEKNKADNRSNIEGLQQGIQKAEDTIELNNTLIAEREKVELRIDGEIAQMKEAIEDLEAKQND